jgi:hypothetical protein
MPIQLTGNSKLQSNEFSVPDSSGNAASGGCRNDVFGFATAPHRFVSRSTAVWGQRFQTGPSLVRVFQQDAPISV